MSRISLSEAAELLGVSIRTLQRWELKGKIKAFRTEGGHRRYEVGDLLGVKNDASLTVAYARVSSQDQKEDLNRQVIVWESYCAKHGWK